MIVGMKSTRRQNFPSTGGGFAVDGIEKVANLVNTFWLKLVELTMISAIKELVPLLIL